MVVLITGASGGLGTAVVKAFLDSGAASVFGVARSWTNHPTENGRFHAMEADLLDPEACKLIAEQSQPIDAMIHVMGGFGGGKPVSETSDSDWNAMMQINLTSAFYMIRAVLPQMLANNRGRIIALGSRAGVEPMTNFAAYSVSKAALIALIKTVALEVKDTGITANVVLPSIIDTPANRAAMPKADRSKWVSPNALANLLVWLASGKAADINGAVIPMYGKS